MHLRSLILENFRCFRQATYEFTRLTLLTGRNSSGKSTVINAVLTILQGSHRESHPFTLTPNGDLCTLGAMLPVLLHTLGKYDDGGAPMGDFPRKADGPWVFMGGRGW